MVLQYDQFEPPHDYVERGDSVENDKKILAIKDLVWVVLSFLFAFGLLGAGWSLGGKLIHDSQPIKESLQVIATITAIPAFLLMATYNRISQETIGVIIGAMIGFALGKFG